MESDLWKTFGHSAIKTILNRQVATQKFPHAYLFKGPKGVGKKTLALEFAKKVLATQKLENHPDFAILEPEGEITMAQILDFLSKLSYKPFISSKKIAVINNIQNLNLQSSNALLKTLEEPSESTIIVLVSNSSNLLPTIVSRCQLLNFNSFSIKQLTEFAEQNNLKTAKESYDLSFGSPARLIKLCRDEEFLQNEKDAVGEYQKLKSMPLSDKLASIGELAELDANELSQNFSTWLMWQNSQLKEQPEDYKKVQVLLGSIISLKQNKNKKLILQGLLLKI